MQTLHYKGDCVVERGVVTGWLQGGQRPRLKHLFIHGMDDHHRTGQDTTHRAHRNTPPEKNKTLLLLQYYTLLLFARPPPDAEFEETKNRVGLGNDMLHAGTLFGEV